MFQLGTITGNRLNGFCFYETNTTGLKPGENESECIAEAKAVWRPAGEVAAVGALILKSEQVHEERFGHYGLAQYVCRVPVRRRQPL